MRISNLSTVIPVTTAVTIQAKKQGELILAEIHHLLLPKQENHTLDAADKKWFDISKKHFDAHPELDGNKIKNAIVMARLTGKNYRSVIIDQEIDKSGLEMAQWNAEREITG